MTSILDNERVRKRFFAKVEKTNGCWNWKACVGSSGYGRFGVGPDTLNAPRVSWIMHRGEVPKGLWILHTCDNKLCVRPEHLYLGTAKENVMDTIKRTGLNVPKWEKHRDAKLTWIAVRAIRDLYKSGSWSYSRLGLKFGVSKSCIDGVVSGRHWKGDPNDLRVS
jgi:hypothetical protein